MATTMIGINYYQLYSLTWADIFVSLFIFYISGIILICLNFITLRYGITRITQRFL